MGQYEEFIRLRTYARWLYDRQRRETWAETVDRYCNYIFNESFNCSKIPDKTRYKIRTHLLNMEVVPSMRLIWSAGDNCRRDNIAAYNCTAMAIHSLECFGEALYILLSGAGVGYSVESRYTSQLPTVAKQRNLPPLKHVVEDSRLGWKQSVDYGVREWFSGRDVVFDYSRVRPAGTPLVTSGGYASGSEALRRCHEFIREVILAAQGRRLRPAEVSDIMCEIGSAVVCGGVRRTAMICLCDVDDEEMRTYKHGTFHPRRYMANISAVYRKKPNVLDFAQEFIDMARSGSGERGIFNLVAARKSSPRRRDKSQLCLTNPCFRGDMRILTTDGYQRFDELATLDSVQIINKDGNISTGKVWANPEPKEFIVIILDDDARVYTTEDHIFMLDDGTECEASQLKDKKIKRYKAEPATVTGIIRPHIHSIVYDFSEPLTNWGVVEGCVVHNCAETILRDMGCCNLTEVIIRPYDDFDTVCDKIKTATWLGCIQSTFTYFPHLRPEWKTNAEEERLLGVSLTGLCDNIELITPETLRHWRTKAIKTAKTASSTLSINMPAAITLGKPSGTTSQVANCSSGLHSRWAPYYIRRVRISIYDPLFKCMVDQGMPWEMDRGNHDTAVFAFPMASPAGAKVRADDTALGQLEWYKMLLSNWAEQNMSCSIYVKEHEWLEVTNYVYNNFDVINGISFFPYDNTFYPQAPYEEITEEQYSKMVKEIPDINFSRLAEYEQSDLTTGAQTLACSGDKCELS